jgi:hypothetical protein
LLAAAIALPADAGTPHGFSAADLAAAGKTAQANDTVVEARQLAAATDTLRAAFILNPRTAWTTLTPDERATLQNALGEWAAGDDIELAWFMRGAAVRVGTPAGGAMTGLYNPVADAWLLLGWARSGGEWRVIEAAITPGARLRPASEGADWTARAGVTARVLASAHQLALHSFDELTGEARSTDVFAALTLTRDEDRPEVHGRIDRWLGTLAGWRRDPARMKAFQELRGQIIGRRVGAIAVSDKQPLLDVMSLPLNVRTSLTPVAAIAHDDGASLLMVSPLFPSLMVMADFGGDARLKGLGIVDLTHAALQGESR